jgi:hypothetical protein
LWARLKDRQTDNNNETIDENNFTSDTCIWC